MQSGLWTADRLGSPISTPRAGSDCGGTCPCLGNRWSIVDEPLDPAPAERRSDALPADHPAANPAPAARDCPAQVPAEVKKRAAAAHGNHEPPDAPVRAEELV